MGVVWQARDERLERTVAVKQLLTRPGLSESEAADTRRRAMREARTAARLQHRNAIALFDVAEHDGDPWLVMEFLRSRSLSAVLSEQGTLPLVAVAKLGSQVASALAAAHDAGIVHRDVKPGNVLLDDDGLAKITDFGISRTMDDGTVTETGMLAGTPAYLAPEVARGKHPERASDVFSLGATLYHAIEGSPPFGTNTNALAVLHAAASGNVPPPRRAGLLTPVLTSMLNPDPALRPTMEQVASGLADLETRRLDEHRTVPVHLAAPAVTAVQPGPPTRHDLAPPRAAGQVPAPRGTSRRAPLIIALVAVFAVAGVVTAVVLNSQRDRGTVSGPTSTVESPAPTTTTTSNAPVTQVQGPIDWSQAGQLVIDYYSSLANPQARWEMLSRNGRAEFGDLQGFQQHWAQFKAVSARNARGVTPNQDGSVNVPVDVTYTGQDGAERPEHKVLRVVTEDGRLAIDSAAR